MIAAVIADTSGRCISKYSAGRVRGFASLMQPTLTLARRAVRGFCRYAIIRTSSIAINAAGFAEVES
jgi:hypothetical protein